MGKIVRDFFERDDVSRLTAGVKQTITRLKVKKRIMKESIVAIFFYNFLPPFL
jgi:hypothetical protein